jgi:DNA-binding transcriptional ArsR family regulator
MNYILEIRAFYDRAESLNLSSSCICFWHALMYQANKLGWKEEFSMPLSTLELRTGLSKSAIYTARKTLRQHGLIRIRERLGRQASMYAVNSLCLFSGHNTDETANATRTKSRTQYVQKAGTYNKQNRTKQNGVYTHACSGAEGEGRGAYERNREAMAKAMAEDFSGG